MIANFFSKYGDQILTEPILSECRNKADQTSFFYILTKHFLEDLLLSLSNSVESMILTNPELTGVQCIDALKALHSSQSFIDKVMLPLIDHKIRETNCDFDKESITDLVSKKISAENRKWENTLLESMAKEIKGVLAALVKSNIIDKDVQNEDELYFNNYLDQLRNKSICVSPQI